MRVASLATGALACLAYLAMTPAVSGDKDGSEFTLVLATLGAAHPTGYPLYTMVGHAFVSLAHALGASWPFAANAFSALGGAVAIGLLHALSSRLLRGAGVSARGAAAVALLPAVAFGMNPAWTLETTARRGLQLAPGVGDGGALFACWALEALAPDGPRAPTARIAALGGLLVGLGLTHHLTSVFVSLPLGVALLLALARRGALGIGVLAIGLGGFAIGISSVAYLFWRASHPALVQWPMLGPDTVWQHLLGAQYRGYLGRFAPNPMQQRFLCAHVYPWLAPALLVLLAAPFTRSRAVPREWRFAVAAAAMLQTAYVFSYGVPDPSAYFLPVLALGLAVLPAWLAEAVPIARRRGAWIAGVAALALAVASTVWFRIGLERVGTYERFDAFVHRMWMQRALRRRVRDLRRRHGAPALGVPAAARREAAGDRAQSGAAQLSRASTPRSWRGMASTRWPSFRPCRRRWTKHRRAPCSRRSPTASTTASPLPVVVFDPAREIGAAPREALTARDFADSRPAQAARGADPAVRSGGAPLALPAPTADDRIASVVAARAMSAE